MKVSIIMPVYNRETVVEEAINSILNQTMSDLELIIIDDFSTDNTVKVIESINDERIKLIKAPFKTNIPMLRNAGLNMACGEYIGYMDSDDISVPERLEWECDYLDKHPEVGVVSGSCQTFGSYEGIHKVPLTNEEIVGSLPVRCSMSNGACLMRRSLIDAGLRYRPEYFVCEDYGFWVDLIGKTRFANLDKILLKVRYWEQQTTSGSWREQYKMNIRAAINKEIHKTAFTNLGIEMKREELEAYSYYMGDTAQFNQYTEQDAKDAKNLIGVIGERMAKVCPDFVDGFNAASGKKVRRMIERIELTGDK